MFENNDLIRRVCDGKRELLDGKNDAGNCKAGRERCFIKRSMLGRTLQNGLFATFLSFIGREKGF